MVMMTSFIMYVNLYFPKGSEKQTKPWRNWHKLFDDFSKVIAKSSYIIIKVLA